MIFDKFVGFATEEEMLTESAKMVENNTLWGGEIPNVLYVIFVHTCSISMSLLCSFCNRHITWVSVFLHCFIPVL